MRSDQIANALSDMVREEPDETMDVREKLAEYLAELGRTVENQQREINSLKKRLSDLEWRAN